MKTVKVLGAGCSKCESTADLVADEARALEVEVDLEKVTDVAEIMKFGVLKTPAVVIDGEVVHAGGVPKPGEVRRWFEAG